MNRNLIKLYNMNSPKNLFSTKNRQAFQLPIVFNPDMSVAPAFNNKLPQMPALLLKVHSGQSPITLLQDIRIPLNHINLSVEMIDSAITENELNICLGVILRNSTRIDRIVNNFIVSKQIGQQYSYINKPGGLPQSNV